MNSPRSPLLERVVSGESRELLQLAARGLLPVAPDELIPVQVDLARGGDRDLARQAADALATLDPRVAAYFLERSAGADELAYFAHASKNAVVLTAVLRRRDVPRPLLRDLARRLPADLQELLLLRQDAIIEEPAILDALDENPELSVYARRRIGEYRQHLLPRHRALVEEGPPAAPADGLVEADDHTAQQAILEVRGEPADGDLEDVTGLSEGQIRLLPIPVRLRLARGAHRVLRNMLIRDPHPRVALAVLKVNAISDQEVEQIAASRLVVGEVFDEIVGRRQWIGKYPILRTLAFNPRVPVPLALRLVPRLAVRDLRALARDRNVADPVRAMAHRLYLVKRQ